MGGNEVVWRRLVGYGYVQGAMDGEVAPGLGKDGRLTNGYVLRAGVDGVRSVHLV